MSRSAISKQASKHRSYTPHWLIGLVLLVCSIGIFFYFPKTTWSTLRVTATAWLASHHAATQHKKMITAQAFTMTHPAPAHNPDVQFEFYTALPNMNMQHPSHA